jgi:hypothetical protein
MKANTPVAPQAKNSGKPSAATQKTIAGVDSMGATAIERRLMKNKA